MLKHRRENKMIHVLHCCRCGSYSTPNHYQLKDGGALCGFCGDKNPLGNLVRLPLMLVTSPHIIYVAFTRSGKHAHGLHTDLGTCWRRHSSTSGSPKSNSPTTKTACGGGDKARANSRSSRTGRTCCGSTTGGSDYRLLLGWPEGKWPGMRFTMPHSYRRGIAARTRPRNTSA
jgi:hypothetical protein